MKNKVRNVLAALVLCMSAIALPVTAYASTGSDTTPPTLSATLNNDKLAVEASDDMSGVEAVYVDDTRINSLVNGKGTVALKDYAGDGKEVTVYAVDYSGNRSKEVKLVNPYYEEPAQTQAASSAAPNLPVGKHRPRLPKRPRLLLHQTMLPAIRKAARPPRPLRPPRKKQGLLLKALIRRTKRNRLCRKGHLPRKAPARSWIQPPSRKMISSFIPSPPRTEMCFTLSLTGSGIRKTSTS